MRIIVIIILSIQLFSCEINETSSKLVKKDVEFDYIENSKIITIENYNHVQRITVSIGDTLRVICDYTSQEDFVSKKYLFAYSTTIDGTDKILYDSRRELDTITENKLKNLYKRAFSEIKPKSDYYF